MAYLTTEEVLVLLLKGTAHWNFSFVAVFGLEGNISLSKKSVILQAVFLIEDQCFNDFRDVK